MPAGKRVGVPELDQLDVLCFSSQAFEEIVAEAVREFDTGDEHGMGITVDRREDVDEHAVEQYPVAVGLERHLRVRIAV